MSIIKDFFARARERKEKLANYQDDDRIVNTVQVRKKSHWERELIKDLEKEKEQNIKQAIMWENKRRMLEDKLKSRRMMKFNPDMWKQNNKDSFLGGGF